MLTGRNPQQSLSGPAPSLDQASPCAGAACPSLDVERATASPRLPPSIFWELVLTPLFNGSNAGINQGASIFVFQAALALFPGPLGAPWVAQGCWGRC